MTTNLPTAQEIIDVLVRDRDSITALLVVGLTDKNNVFTKFTAPGSVTLLGGLKITELQLINLILAMSTTPAQTERPN